MTIKQPDFTELNALAIEACDMWQAHLTSLTNDPTARAELARFLEPQRRLFADWTSMMQQGNPWNQNREGGSHDNSQRTPTTTTGGQPAASAVPPSRGDDNGDDSLRVAQLAYRVAELEKRLAELESLIAEAGRPKESRAAGSSRRTQRAAS